MDYKKIIQSFENCPCGQKHECGVWDIVIERGAVNEVGKVLERNGFPRKLLVVADKTTFAVSEGIIASLEGFDVTLHIYESLRVATMDDVRLVESYLNGRAEAVLAVGTGSIHDTCRLACAELSKPLCLFATASSMDGFASYSAPIVDDNFKITYPAKCPEVIIADTAILAAAPNELKSAGFGDMVSKYVALIDWQVSHLLTGESYCERVAALTRYAADAVMKMAGRVTENDEQAVTKIFEGLLLTGIAMSFTKTSRPGSGTEHIMAHFIECRELLEGKVPDFHGEDVGVTTLTILKLYKSLLSVDGFAVHAEQNDWAVIRAAYGKLAESMMELNLPNTITDGLDPHLFAENFEKIKEIIASVPSYEEVRESMRRAGCKLDYNDIRKSKKLFSDAFVYHPYMRRRLSLRRLLNMTEFSDGLLSLAGMEEETV